MIGWDLWAMSFVSGPQVRGWPSTRDLAVWEQPLPGLRMLGAVGGNCPLVTDAAVCLCPPFSTPHSPVVSPAGGP